MSNHCHFPCALAVAALAALAALAPVASAQVVKLSWTNCYADGAVTNRNFACNTNSGLHTLVASYVTPAAGVPQVTGNNVVVDMAWAGTSVPAWWQCVGPGACRAGLATSVAAPASIALCQDAWGGLATSLVSAYQIGAIGPSTSRLKASVVANPEAVADQAGATEYFSCSFLVNDTNSVGTNACGGCSTPGCFVIKAIAVTSSMTAANLTFSNFPSGGLTDYVSWQGGAGATSDLGSGCPNATPTRGASWGRIKDLYR